MKIFNTWYICVILYLAFAVIYDQSYKKATKKLTKAGPLTIILEIMAGLVALCLFPLFEIKFSTDIKVYLFWGLAIIFYTLNDRINTTVRSGIEASTFSMLKQLSTVFMILAGILFFKEPFIWNKFLGAFLIIFSNVFMFFRKEDTKLNKYVILGILGNLSYAIALFLDVNISDNFNLAFYVAVTLIIPSIIISIFERVKLSDLKTEFKNGDKKAIVLTAISGGLSIAMQLRSYQLQEASIVAPLCALAVILNVAAGYLFMGEKDNLIRKVIAAVLIIISIILIRI